MEQRRAGPGGLAPRAQCWTLTDGHAGNARQASALAAALGLAARDWLLEPRPPWGWAAPRLLPGSEHAFGAGFARAQAAPPALAIGCGRQGALATRLLRAAGARTVQILDPRLDPAHWDLVVVPEHDALRGANVVTLLGSLHPVDDAWLTAARTAFPALAELPRPRTALLLGGSSRHARFDRLAFEALASMLRTALAQDGGSVLATTSRRTPRDLCESLRRHYAGSGGVAPGAIWTGPDDGPNPYPGLLAWADRIVCSPDSVNMISEACATHVPVFVFDPARVAGRPRRFLDVLLARGRVRTMDATLAPYEVEPLRETARVAAEVRARLGLPVSTAPSP
ncbi:mitochondrial fission ELM1 family protein [Luteimonas sp. RD2P54]|uniref:Mitochondrial fission ELM1 family protein n=1 Tax=Luteimonas endophytica TaxID=3042023 RepID=A0ABT6JDL9_9GAMM|nr:mitochondrial fission ELM1 family protein [Luteimonas endophytica]MDH5824927.1 mitochondrial fission ELM1 family protein [Luteimonas endophytica]